MLNYWYFAVSATHGFFNNILIHLVDHCFHLYLYIPLIPLSTCILLDKLFCHSSSQYYKKINVVVLKKGSAIIISSYYRGQVPI